jgi:hypothetical protein
MKADLFTELYGRTDKPRPGAEDKKQPKPEASPKKPAGKK